MLRKDFQLFKTQLWSWPAETKLMKIRGFQKCKIHSCSLQGFRITASQSWFIFRWNQDSIPGSKIAMAWASQVQIPAKADLHQLWQAVILKVEECILHFWKPPIFTNFNQLVKATATFWIPKIHPKDKWFHTSLCTRGVYYFLEECKQCIHEMPKISLLLYFVNHHF